MIFGAVTRFLSGCGKSYRKESGYSNPRLKNADKNVRAPMSTLLYRITSKASTAKAP